MLGSLLTKLKTTKIAQNISQNYHKIKEHIQSKMSIIEIVPNVYHIDFPDLQNYGELMQHLGEREFQIWNISQYRYDKTIEDAILQRPEQADIHHLCFEYYSNLPLYELMIALNSIHSFLAINPKNRVYLHCQDNKIRSGVFLACLLFKFHILNIQDLSEAILYINKKLSINLQVGHVGEGTTGKYKNLHVFFKNFVNFVNNPSMINKKQLKLIKVIVNQAPKLKITNQMLLSGASAKQLKVGVQIRWKEQIIFKNIYENSVFEGDSLCLQLSNKAITLSDDFLVIVKYIFKGKIYNVMRVQMNTNFIYENFYRTYMQLIDLSAYCQIDDPASMFIDFMFQEHYQYSSLSKLDGITQEQKMPHKQQSKLCKSQQHPTNIQTKQQQLQATQTNNMQSFSVEQHDQLGDHPQVDENQINRKIEEVIKNINKKQPQDQQDQPEEDLDDYLSKLESQV